jgi:hypothetical protein
MKTHWEVEAYLHAFLTSALDAFVVYLKPMLITLNIASNYWKIREK